MLDSVVLTLVIHTSLKTQQLKVK